MMASIGSLMLIAAVQGATLESSWPNMQTPLYQHNGWSVKDATFGQSSNGSFAMYFSAFYTDASDGQFRCHVAGVETDDFATFSEPVWSYDGTKDGWMGMCSPNIYRRGPRDFVMTFNSWGDLPGKDNVMFYTQSQDLFAWSKPKPLASKLTKGDRAIDAAVAFDDDMGAYVLMFKKGYPNKGMKTVVAHSKTLDGDFTLFGIDGTAKFILAGGKTADWTHENFNFFKQNGEWWVASSDYGSPAVQPITTWVYRKASDDWLTWDQGKRLNIPIVKGFNTRDMANAGYVYSTTVNDPYTYLLFAGTTERTSYEKRGDNRLGMARSRDMTTWELP